VCSCVTFKLEDSQTGRTGDLSVSTGATLSVVTTFRPVFRSIQPLSNGYWVYFFVSLVSGV
jgi:hypothetical protein